VRYWQLLPAVSVSRRARRQTRRSRLLWALPLSLFVAAWLRASLVIVVRAFVSCSQWTLLRLQQVRALPNPRCHIIGGQRFEPPHLMVPSFVGVFGDEEVLHLVQRRFVVWQLTLIV
jgi:hypothetical protein